jgi:hypothetical protein
LKVVEVYPIRCSVFGPSCHLDPNIGYITSCDGTKGDGKLYLNKGNWTGVECSNLSGSEFYFPTSVKSCLSCRTANGAFTIIGLNN